MNSVLDYGDLYLNSHLESSYLGDPGIDSP